MALGIADRIFNITGPDVSDIYVHCPHCGAQGYVSVTEDEGDRLIDSEHVQDVLPHSRRSSVSRSSPAGAPPASEPPRGRAAARDPRAAPWLADAQTVLLR